MLGELNERSVTMKELWEALSEMNSSKSSGLDDFPVKY